MRELFEPDKSDKPADPKPEAGKPGEKKDDKPQAAPGTPPAQSGDPDEPPKDAVADYQLLRAVDLVKRSTVIDMLSVLTLDFGKQARWFADPESFTAADLQPYKDSGINVIHPRGVFVRLTGGHVTQRFTDTAMRSSMSRRFSSSGPHSFARRALSDGSRSNSRCTIEEDAAIRKGSHSCRDRSVGDEDLAVRAVGQPPRRVRLRWAEAGDAHAGVAHPVRRPRRVPGEVDLGGAHRRLGADLVAPACLHVVQQLPLGGGHGRALGGQGPEGGL